MASFLVGRNAVASLLYRPGCVSSVRSVPQALRRMSTTVGTEIPVNYKKEGKHPKVLPRDQYPEWLWGITTYVSLTECEKKGYDNMTTMKEKRRYVQLLNTKDVKEKNFNKTL